MSGGANTLLLRLEGPMQSWGTGSRLQIRRTDPWPSKSGVLGILLCAQGVPREKSAEVLRPLVELTMGVRVDSAGDMGWDYHTAGAKYGIRRADGKGVKFTATTDKLETLLSRRQYLFDASFLVALQGDPQTIRTCAESIQNPVWTPFLGRKCCVPTRPIYEDSGEFASLLRALASVPARARFGQACGAQERPVILEHPAGSPPPAEARLVYDVPRGFGYYNHAPRWVFERSVTVDVLPPMFCRPSRKGSRRVDYTSPQWKAVRRSRLLLDRGLCVFCKSPAVQVHHVNYDNVGRESLGDLRSLCELCHDACTMLEYGRGLSQRRVDPADPAMRDDILAQVERMLRERRAGRRRALLAAGRATGDTYFDNAASAAEVA